jgi:hypothetical protein
MQLKNWNCLDKSEWSLSMMWVSTASGSPLVCVGQTVQIFLFHKSSWRIWWIVSLLRYNSFTIILRAQQQSLVAISRTFMIVSAFWEVEGCLLLGSTWRSSHPSLNHLNNSDTCVQEGLFHQLESFSSCVAHCDTKLNVHSLLLHYEL